MKKGMIKLKDVSCTHGSPMGRSNSQLTGICHMQRVPFVDGCYDLGGAYWGLPANLWVAEDAEGQQAFVRARNREEAKAEFQEINNEEITFYR